MGGPPPDFGMGYPPPFGAPIGDPLLAAGSNTAPPPPAPTPAASTGNAFLDGLPPGQLTAPEKDLAGAVSAFLDTWRQSHEADSHPNMVHLGADKSIRESKALVLPREVSLKAWIKHRLSSEVNIVGQSVVPVARQTP